MFKVRKKDGSLEEYDRNKIVNGVMRAGGLAEDAEKVAAAIDAWLPTAVVEGVVNSSQIRLKGLEVLGTVNPTVAASFGSYKKEACPTCGKV